MKTDAVRAQTTQAPAAARPVASVWSGLPTAKQATEWEKIRPGTFAEVMASVERAERHARAMAWADFVLRALGLVAGLGSVGILGWTAAHFATSGAATQGLGVFGAGSASIVGAFLSVRRGRGQD